MLQNESMIDLILQAHKYETVNPMNLEGLSHFHIACTRNNVSVIEYFLKQGVDINMKVIDTSLNWAGCRPINFAIYYECPDVIKTLLMHNAHVNRDDIWHTPVQYAYIAANKDIVKLLLNKNVLRCNPSQVKKLSHFYHACKKDDVSEIEKLILFGKAIKEPINLNSQIWTGCTPLHLAIRHRSMKVAIFLLKNGADILICDGRGKTPLHLAFETKQMKLVDLILTNYIRFDNNAQDSEGFSHFHIACMRDKIEAVESFLKNGVDVNSTVDVNSKFWPGCTALHFAVQFEHKEIVDLLLKYNANVTVKNVNNLTPLDIAIKSTDSNKCWRDEVDDIFAIIDSILTASFFNGSSSFDNRGFSVLHITSINGDINAIKNFLKFHPKSINQPINWSESDWFGYTPLHFAVHFGNREAVEVLVQFGADISIKNGEGNTPLHVAFSLRNHLRAVENFEIICASDNPIGEEGFSHFHIACQIGAFRAVEYFINQGVDVNQPSKFTGIYEYTGQSPLHLAVNNEVINEKVLQLLLEKGADVHAKDAELDTPLHYTKNNTTTRALELLLCHGADVNAQNMFNETPLYVTCHDGDYVDRKALPEKMILLLDNGADIDIANDEGELPLTVLKYLSDDEVKYRCIVAMLKHIKKLKIIGSFVSDENERLYSELLRQCINAGRYRETEFSNLCNEELNLLRNVNIDSYTTLHDIIFKNVNEMSVHSENQTFQKIFKSVDFREKFPIYGPLIKLKYKKGLARRPLLNSSKISLNFLTGFPLPDACSERILQFLGDNDLRNIISSKESIQLNVLD
ncbi:hypothetical protein QAD02_018534 [Eretmocerus hayati]|uniref:Uncharacterized protein n=1 Tax=Eretmocerus hayati TaxID=131215 RepID=A0ACC2PGZ0_9HYME|nr:hypothetical protein QAD02_018534 [Eretmocerus hayati]